MLEKEVLGRIALSSMLQTGAVLCFASPLDTTPNYVSCDM